jgi:hypothetical protein
MTLPLACCTGTAPAFCSGICCLMRFLRSGLIEVLDIGTQDTMQLLLLQDEQVIETLATHAAQKTFTDGIGAFRVIGRFQDLDAAGLGNPGESHPKLAIVISDEILRPHTKGRGFAKRYGQSTRPWESVSHRRGSLCASAVRR